MTDRESAACFLALRSGTPGRARWESAALLNRPDVCQGVRHILLRAPGIREVEANPVSGRVLVRYTPSLAQDEVRSTLARAIADSLCATPPARSKPQAKRAPILRLLDLTAEHRARMLATFAISFADRLFEAAPPAMIGASMDVVTQGRSSFLGKLGFRTVPSQLFALAGISMIVWTADALMGYLRALSTARLAGAIQQDLRDRAYSHMQTLDIGQIERRPVSGWMNLLQGDIGRIGQFLESGIDPIVTILTNGVIVTATFLSRSPQLFAVQLVMLPGLYLLSSLLLGPIRKRYEAAYLAGERLAGALHGNVAGMPTIQVFGAQEHEARRIRELGSGARALSDYRAELSAAYVPAIQMVVGCGFLTTLAVGGLQVNDGNLSIASYNVMGFSSLRLLVALGSLGYSLEQYQRAGVSIERVLDFLDRRSQIPDGPRALPARQRGTIELRKVYFAYEPGVPVLKDLSMKFAAGKTTGIVGSTGAGKTTILKLLLRFYDVNDGSIRLDGVDIRKLRVNDLRSLISIVPQQVFLFDGGIRDNIAYGRPDATFEEVQQAARAAQAHDFIQALDGGYDSVIGANGTQLSGGQQQRIAIARALLAGRSILLFDEATSAIDYETESAIQVALRELTAGKTTVIVAHRLSTVRHADLIYVLDEGQVCEEGRHDELIRQNGLYASLWRLQTGEAAPGAAVEKRARKARKSTARKRS